MLNLRCLGLAAALLVVGGGWGPVASAQEADWSATMTVGVGPLNANGSRNYGFWEGNADAPGHGSLRVRAKITS